MTVYIVINKANYHEDTIESVWSTRGLADSARWFHAEHAKLSADDFIVVEREVNTAIKP